MPEAITATVNSPIRLSESAAQRIAFLIEQDGGKGKLFRVAISGGGCNGFQTEFSLDDKVAEDDQVFAEKGVQVVIDAMSLDLIRGSELDFVNELIGSYFSLNNPNAKTTCGCGSSFAV
jgi:iron-sulfur cluster insertion protein